MSLASKLESYYKETAYFCSPSFQNFQVLISLSSEGWIAERLKIKCETNICWMNIVRVSLLFTLTNYLPTEEISLILLYQTILSQWSLFILPENIWYSSFSNVFRGCKKGALAWNGLKLDNWNLEKRSPMISPLPM